MRDLKAAVPRSPETYRAALLSALGQGLSDADVDEHDDLLFEEAERDAPHIAVICNLLFEVLMEAGRPIAAGHTWNTLFKCQIVLGDTGAAFDTLESGIDFAIRYDLRHLGESLCANAGALYGRGLIHLDEVPKVLGQCARYHIAVGEHSLATHALCQVGSVYGDLGAFQPAYRALADAQRIALEHELWDEQLNVLETQGFVATQEEDHGCAEAEFRKVDALCKRLGRQTPPRILGNLAALIIRRGDYAGAKPLLEIQLQQYLDGSSSPNGEMAQAQMNLALSCRETGDNTRAIALSESAIALADDVAAEMPATTDLPVDTRITAATCRLRLHDADSASEHIAKAISLIDARLADASRLHFRRGLRAPFSRRLRSVLCSFPSLGPSRHVLSALAFTRCNVIVDWIAVLDWHDDLLGHGECPDELRARATAALRSVMALGAPILRGLREKYDDALEGPHLGPFDYAKPWQDLNEVILESARKLDLKVPSARSSIESVEQLLTRLLADMRVAVFVFHAGEHLHLIVVCGDDYERISVPIDSFKALYSSLAAQSLGEQALGTSVHRVNEAVEALGPLVDVIIRRSSGCKELVIFPDPLSHAVPIVAALVANTTFRERVRDGLRLSTCPVASLRKKRLPFCTDGYLLGAAAPQYELPLAEEELRVSASRLGLQLRHLPSSQEDAAKLVEECRAFHVALDGTGLHLFYDPWYADIAGVGMDAWQLLAPEAGYDIAFINACDAGVFNNRNSEEVFRSDEGISRQTLLLLNRHSDVVVPAWRTFDVVAYVFSAIFYDLIGQGKDAVEAYTRTCVRLYELDKAQLHTFLASIESPELRKRTSERFAESQHQFPFRTPYCYGVYQMHSLL